MANWRIRGNRKKQAAYQYTLEGAIHDCDWLDIPDKIKQDYQEFTQNLQANRES